MNNITVDNLTSMGEFSTKYNWNVRYSIEFPKLKSDDDFNFRAMNFKTVIENSDVTHELVLIETVDYKAYEHLLLLIMNRNNATIYLELLNRQDVITRVEAVHLKDYDVTLVRDLSSGSDSEILTYKLTLTTKRKI